MEDMLQIHKVQSVSLVAKSKVVAKYTSPKIDSAFQPMTVCYKVNPRKARSNSVVTGSHVTNHVQFQRIHEIVFFFFFCCLNCAMGQKESSFFHFLMLSGSNYLKIVFVYLS